MCSVFCILEDITVPVFNGIATFEDLKVYQGTRLVTNFTYSSRNLNQRFILPNSGIDTDLISVLVRNNEQSTSSTKYNRQDSLFEINQDSKVSFYKKLKMKDMNLFSVMEFLARNLKRETLLRLDILLQMVIVQMV